MSGPRRFFPHPDVSIIDIVEAAASHVEQARKDLQGVDGIRIFHSLFEDFEPDCEYDTILMSGVVKHVPNDAALVRRARRWLRPGGVVIASTPNCRAFHRRLGAYMGFELSPCTHNSRDQSVFNVHIYDRYSWRALFAGNGYVVKHLKGVGMKLLGTEEMILSRRALRHRSNSGGTEKNGGRVAGLRLVLGTGGRARYITLNRARAGAYIILKFEEDMTECERSAKATEITRAMTKRDP